MKPLRLFLYAFIFIWINSEEQNDSHFEKKIAKLTDSTIENFLKSNTPIFILFCTPWLMSCKEFMPKFYELSNRPFIQNIEFATVDSSAEIKTAIKYKIATHPSLLLISEHNFLKYNGQMTLPRMQQFLDKRTNPNLIELKSEIEMERLNSTIFAFLLQMVQADSDQIKLFQEISNDNANVLFFYTLLRPASVVVGPMNKINFIAYRKFNDGNQVICENRPFFKEEINQFIKQTTLPNVLELTEKTADATLRKSQHSIIMFYNPNNLGNLAKFENVASQKQDSIFFIQANRETEFTKKLEAMISVETDDAIRIIEYPEEGLENLFCFLGEITEENILNFLKEFESKSLQPFLFSELPNDDSFSGLIDIVSTNYNQIVYDESKDVVVFYSIDNHLFTKNTREWFAKFAKKVKKDDSLVFCEFNMSRNRHVDTIDYIPPQIMLFPKERKRSPFCMFEEYNENGMNEFLSKTLDKSFENRGKLGEIEDL